MKFGYIIEHYLSQKWKGYIMLKKNLIKFVFTIAISSGYYISHGQYSYL